MKIDKDDIRMTIGLFVWGSLLALMCALLASCSSSKIVYQRDTEGKIWKSHSEVSTITGLKYNK
jgi:hypothetical protein